MEEPKKVVSLVNSNPIGTKENAWVTIVMCNDVYVPGAVVLALSLRWSQTKHDIVCMVTPDVSLKAKDQLSRFFDHVIQIPYLTIQLKSLEFKTPRQTKLYSRWANQALTKWTCIALTQWKKVCFLDADMMVVRNSDDLFDLQAPAGTFSNAYFVRTQGTIKNVYLPAPPTQVQVHGATAPAVDAQTLATATVQAQTTTAVGSARGEKRKRTDESCTHHASKYHRGHDGSRRTNNYDRRTREPTREGNSRDRHAKESRSYDDGRKYNRSHDDDDARRGHSSRSNHRSSESNYDYYRHSRRSSDDYTTQSGSRSRPTSSNDYNRHNDDRRSDARAHDRHDRKEDREQEKEKQKEKIKLPPRDAFDVSVPMPMHGSEISCATISRALLERSIVAGGCMILLNTSATVWDEFVEWAMYKYPVLDWSKTCYSGKDEQAISAFYALHKKESWRHISCAYQFLSWMPKWDDPLQKPAIMHYMMRKPWTLWKDRMERPEKGQEFYTWIDARFWWSVARIARAFDPSLEMYIQDAGCQAYQLQKDTFECFYCHQAFASRGKVTRTCTSPPDSLLLGTAVPNCPMHAFANQHVWMWNLIIDYLGSL